MSRVITLPTGATATIKEAKDLLVKDRKKIMRSIDEGGTDVDRALSYSDAIIAITVLEWSFDFAIPSVKIANLDEITVEDFDFLTQETKEALASIFPTLGESVENEQNPKAITDPFKG